MLDNNFLFSIITPIRNGENFIEKYLESLLNQSYQNWEAIIVDDKSKDKGIEIIRKNINSDERFKFLNVKDKKIICGPYLARNVGLNASKGDYICFHDIDDYWLPEKLSNQHMILNSDRSIKLIFSSYLRYNSKFKSYKIRKPLIIGDLKTTLKFINPIPMVDACIRKDTISKTRFKPINHEDYLFWQEIVKKLSKKDIFIDSKINSAYRISCNSISNSKLLVINWIWRIYKINNRSIFINVSKIFIRGLLQFFIKLRENRIDIKKNIYDFQNNIF